MKCVNTVVKICFPGLSDDEPHNNLDTFWIEYNNSNHSNDPFGSGEFIWSGKYIRDGNISLWH